MTTPTALSGQVHANTLSSSSHTPLLTADSAVPSPVTEDFVPAMSEYLQQMSLPDANSGTTESSPLTKVSDTWRSGNLTTKRLENFAEVVLPSHVQAELDQPFGKDSPSHYFISEKCFRHVLLPVLISGFLSCRATKLLEKTCRRTRQLQLLRKKYSDVDFLPLQGFQADWESTTTIRADWKAMTLACLLHFDGDVATMVRWIGGPHVNAHLDIPAILSKLRLIVDPDIHADVSRILLLGAPALCQASAHQGTRTCTT